MHSMRALHLTAGLHHPSEATAPFWDSLFEECALSVVTHEDIDAGCASLAAQPYDLLVVSALRWSMTQHERYAPQRARWAYDIPAVARDAIVAHLERGRPLLAMHAAIISFDTWPQWEDILGGRWVWNQSGHPPYGPTETRVVNSLHPVMQGVGNFQSQDEVYGQLRRSSGCTVLAQSRAQNGDWMPSMWCHQWHGARVLYDALGHDMNSLSDASHRRLLNNGLAWLLDKRSNEVSEDTNHAKH